jgi:hypothetical protein
MERLRLRSIQTDRGHQLSRMPRSIQGDPRGGEPGLQPSGWRITLGCLPVRPGLVYRYIQLVIGRANHSYTDSIMRVKHCSTVRFRYPRHHRSVVIGSGSTSWLGLRNRLMTS